MPTPLPRLGAVCTSGRSAPLEGIFLKGFKKNTRSCTNVRAEQKRAALTHTTKGKAGTGVLCISTYAGASGRQEVKKGQRAMIYPLIQERGKATQRSRPLWGLAAPPARASFCGHKGTTAAEPARRWVEWKMKINAKPLTRASWQRGGRSRVSRVGPNMEMKDGRPRRRRSAALSGDSLPLTPPLLTTTPSAP